MTNDERIKIRISKDKYRRKKRKEKKYSDYDDFDKVITHQHYNEGLNKRKKGVSWKYSVQDYTHNSIVNIVSTIDTLKKGELPPLRNNSKVTIYERGKERKIFPVSISDRMTQGVLCDYALIPVITDSLIYDNGASLQGKGVDFARRRIEKHLRCAIKEYGRDCYVLIFDFKSYFESIPHDTCFNVLDKHFNDKRIVDLTMAIIHSYQESDIRLLPDENERNRKYQLLKSNKLHGICLGSQVSQVMALAIPNRLDHYIKDELGIKHYVRYMDDGVIIHNDKAYLNDVLVKLKTVANELGLTFNVKKTRIVKLRNGFTFMKVRYYTNKDGKLVKKLVHSGIVRERRKLKKIYKKIMRGELTIDDAYNSMQSWLAHSKIAKSHHTAKSMKRLYKKLFGNYKI